jgi:hypothetical protein
MREVDQIDCSYSVDEECVSVFVGCCESEELFDKYMTQDYELLDCGCIGSEFGIDFGINFYDEDFATIVNNSEYSTNINDIFKNANVFNLEELKKIYGESLDRSYNVAIVIGKLKYERGLIALENKKFGYFKFLGTFLKE